MDEGPKLKLTCNSGLALSSSSTSRREKGREAMPYAGAKNFMGDPVAPGAQLSEGCSGRKDSMFVKEKNCALHSC